MRISRLSCLLAALLVLSCAESGGTVAVDAMYNLTCPDDSAAECGSLAPDTCLGPVGQRSIVGSRGETTCTGEVLDVRCEALERPDGRTFVALEAYVGDEFAFTLDAILGDGSDEDTCEVTIVEDGADYGGRVTGACGSASPSIDRPCQIANVSTEGGEVVFDLQCQSLLSTITGFGFDVGAVGGGSTTIRFSNCNGF